MTTTVTCPPDLVISAVAELREALLAALGAQEIRVDAAAVERADGAGLQLLVAFVRDRRRVGRSTELRTSEALRAAAESLGLASVLAEASPGGGAA